jgi:FkbM family methyltransferase
VVQRGRWRRTLRYLSRFGLRAAAQAHRAIGREGPAVAVRLPEIGQPLWVRRGTADAATFDEIFLGREYDLSLPDFSPVHIMDLGANVGYTSVGFAARWPQARILAVEPSAANLAQLRRNTAAWPQITVLQAAVWPHPARVRIANPEGDTNSYRMDEATGPEGSEIPGCTVAQLMVRQGWRRIDLLKMDVEGAEAEIFRHGDHWLDRVGVLVVELHDRIAPGCAENLYRALHGRRFAQEVVGRNVVIDLRAAAGTRSAGEPAQLRARVAPRSSEVAATESALSSAWTLTGLVRWITKPAAWLRLTSSSIPKPVRAMPTVPWRSRNSVIKS